MKVCYKQKIDGHVCVRFIANAAVDTEKTKEKIEPLITRNMSDKEIDDLYMDNLVYASIGPEGELINEETATQIQAKLDELGESQLLLDNGKYIEDFRNTEYFIKKAGEWKKEKIESLGVSLPKGAILEKDLSKEQQEEMSAQTERERISGLSPEERIKEKKQRLLIFAREANQMEKDSELLEEKFDKKAWFDLQRAKVEKEYA